MNNSFSIEKLSTSEKIELMEELWANLSGSPDYTPPAWHGKELNHRNNAINEGKITYTDWNEAKEEIRKELS